MSETIITPLVKRITSAAKADIESDYGEEVKDWVRFFCYYFSFPEMYWYSPGVTTWRASNNSMPDEDDGDLCLFAIRREKAGDGDDDELPSLSPHEHDYDLFHRECGGGWSRKLGQDEEEDIFLSMRMLNGDAVLFSLRIIPSQWRIIDYVLGSVRWAQTLFYAASVGLAFLR